MVALLLRMGGPVVRASVTPLAGAAPGAGDAFIGGLALALVRVGWYPIVTPVRGALKLALVYR